MADIVAQILLEAQSDAPPGVLGIELGSSRTLRLEVHQAAGMLSEQLDIRAADALVMLRAHAYAEQRPIAVVARDIVTRRLRIGDRLQEGG
jgi:hypothetical protein